MFEFVAWFNGVVVQLVVEGLRLRPCADFHPVLWWRDRWDRVVESRLHVPISLALARLKYYWKLLVLPSTTVWPIEILRFHLEELIAISLELVLFRHEEVADTTVSLAHLEW